MGHVFSGLLASALHTLQANSFILDGLKFFLAGALMNYSQRLATQLYNAYLECEYICHGSHTPIASDGH